MTTATEVNNNGTKDLNLPPATKKLIISTKGFNLEQEAIENGSKMLPATNDPNYDIPQDTIIGQVLQNCNPHYNEALEIMQGLERSNQAAVDLSGKSLFQIQNGIRSQLELTELIMKRLKDLQKEAQRAEGEYNRHRKNNNISKDAEYGKNPINHFTITGVLLALEVVANAYLCSDTNASGLMGAGVQAIGLASLNGLISLGISMGLFPGVHKKKKPILYNVLIGSYGFLATGLNLSIAHFRQAYIHGGGAMNDVIGRIFESPLTLDLSSWGLFAFGMGVSLCAFKEGLTWNRDPKYRKLTETFKKAKAAFNAKYEEELDKQGRLYDQGMQEFYAVIKRLKDAEISCGDNANKAEIITKRFNDFVHGQNELGNELLKFYRTLNIEMRGDNPPPKYFSEYPDLFTQTLPQDWFAKEKVKKDIASIQAKITGLNAEEEKFSESLRALSKQEAKKLKDLIDQHAEINKVELSQEQAERNI